MSIGINESKFLVCISSSPSSEKIIRWTAKTAKAFDAKWIALYIETPDCINQSKSSSDILKANIELAKSLNGEFIQIEGFNIATSVAEFARQTDITNIVIGKSGKSKKIKNIFKKTLEEQIIELLGNVEVHIIPSNQSEYKIINQKVKRKIHILDIIKTISLIFVSTIFCYIMSLWKFSNINYILIFELAVIIVSLTTKGYIYGIFASIVSVIVYDFFFVEPNYSFHLLNSDYITIIIIMLLVSLITSMLTSRVKIRTNHAVTREKNLESLYVLSQKIINTTSYEDILYMLKDYFTLLFKNDVLIYSFVEDKFCLLDDDIEITDKEKDILEWIKQNKNSAGRFTKNFEKEDKYYFPIFSKNNIILIIGIKCSENMELGYEEKTFIKMAATQFALAFEKQKLYDIQKETIIIAEKEKTRSNLLRAVSHDLRTPLTAIYGSASTIIEEQLDKEKTKKFAKTICDDAQWLIRMVENLLIVTKIKEDGMKLAKKPEVLEEVIGESVQKVKSRTGYNNIVVKLPENLLVVPMDGMLIEQVIINLLDNAIRHSGTVEAIEVIAYQIDQVIRIEVLDNGKGFSNDEILLIEKGIIDSSKKTTDSKKGMGIGLSICYSIIKAHEGKIYVKNREKGGAQFIIELPMEENI